MPERGRILAWVALGSGLGGMARVAAAEAVLRWTGTGFPFGVLAVNLLGSLLIGAFAALTAPEGRWLLDPARRQFFMTGFLGGFTTFSFFSLQTLLLLEAGRFGAAALYGVLTMVGSVAAAWLGHGLGQGWNRRFRRVRGNFV
ncbi:MAG: fluoride efflux transporter CrcB [Puniceicoccaceae bacterium]|nr:MAG: fluoride efflux transporter CrcB [Puniceicoccaceae bacterium]